ncbi:MAG: hypothetical protein QOH46_2890 [Solirubrobacteraceae bacterium]|nr:hypothetical protein [Solirubrobacteraceae bacterium]
MDRAIPAGEPKQTESELAALARLLLETVEDAVITVDESLIVRTWSRGAERMYGRRAEAVLGRHLGEFVRLEMTDAERAEMRRHTAERGRMRRDVVAVRHDGSRLDVELINVAVRDAQGGLVGFLGIHRDISDRKRREQDQRRLVQIVQASSELIGVADLDGRMVFVNDAGRRLVGLNVAEDVTGTNVLDYFVPGDRPLVSDEILPAIRSGRGWSGEHFGHSEIRLRHLATGAAIPVYWDCFRLDDPRTGEPFGLGVVVRDISELKHAEAVLRESQRRLETTLENITDAFVAVDLDWRYTYVNDRALRRIRERSGRSLTREDVLGKGIWELFPDALGSELYVRCHEAMREQRPVELDSYFAPSGEWIEAHVYPSRRGLAIYYRDVSASKRAEADADVRARQQAAVAELGLRALAADDLQALMDEAVSVVSGTLGVELTAIAEILPERDRLVFRAGIGWHDGTVGHATASAGRGSLVGYTVAAGAPVVSAEVASDERFEIPAVVAGHDAVSAMSVVIGGWEEPFGALGAFTTHRRSFSHDDVNFMQAVANVLATAVEREQAQQRLIEVREVERRRIARDLHDEALHDLTYGLALAGRTAAVPGPVAGPNGLVPALERVGEQLRGAIYDLRLGGEEHRPFVELLDSLVDVHRAMAVGYDVELTVHEGVPDRALGAAGIEVLRILGEALTNARRHSGATHVRVRVSASETLLRAEVADDGRGGDPAGWQAAHGGTGIQGMRERAARLQAHLEISADPGSGTTVRVDMPLPGDGREPGPVRVLLVEDHTVVREAIASAFERDAGFQVVGQAASLAQARDMLHGVDVAVLDLGLPDGYGADLIEELRRASPGAQALVLSASLDRADVARAVESGAAGVLNKAAHFDDVVRSVRRLRAGETVMGVDEIVELLRFAGRRREREQRDRRAAAQLTPREREVIQALADGLDTQATAERLHISVRTARNHVSSILAKLGVHSQLQALVFALRYDLVEIRGEPRT